MIGRLVYKLFFKPTLPLRYHLKHFGFSGWMSYKIGEHHMKISAGREKQINTNLNNESAITFCFLTGEKYWNQTIYAIKSLSQNINSFNVKIYSDGSLTNDYMLKIKHIIINAEFVSENDIIKNLNEDLPVELFPTLHFLRNWHPFFRRLIDIHCSKGWSIHLDSDMLFFNKPNDLLTAFNNKKALYMVDHLDKSYFVDELTILKENYNIDCLEKVNGGIIAYNNDLIDYPDLEQKAKILIDNYLAAGPARVEQTLMSYILFQQNATPLKKEKYTIFYDSRINTTTDQIVRHYIFKAKLPYFSSEWKKILH